MSNGSIEPVLMNYSVPDTSEDQPEDHSGSVMGGCGAICGAATGSLTVAIGLAFAVAMLIVGIWYVWFWYPNNHVTTASFVPPNPIPPNLTPPAGGNRWGDRWGRNLNDRPGSWRDNHLGGYPDRWR